MKNLSSPYTVDISVTPNSCLPTGLDTSNFIDITRVGDRWRRYLDTRTGEEHDGAKYQAEAEAGFRAEAAEQFNQPKELTVNPAALGALLKGDFENSLIASTPGGIERQEADGQRALIEGSMLPIDVRGATRDQLTALGFKFGDQIDNIFVQCELPAGWSKVGTEHSMHSKLLDEHGRVRAGIFYKASFYDRSAAMNMTCRFRVMKYMEGEHSGNYRCEIHDGNSVIYVAGEWNRDDFQAGDEFEAQAREHLKARFPDHLNPLAYW